MKQRGRKEFVAGVTISNMTTEEYIGNTCECNIP